MLKESNLMSPGNVLDLLHGDPTVACQPCARNDQEQPGNLAQPPAGVAVLGAVGQKALALG
jgi:hypothetical protein